MSLLDVVLAEFRCLRQSHSTRMKLVLNGYLFVSFFLSSCSWPLCSCLCYMLNIGLSATHVSYTIWMATVRIYNMFCFVYVLQSCLCNIESLVRQVSDIVVLSIWRFPPTFHLVVLKRAKCPYLFRKSAIWFLLLISFFMQNSYLKDVLWKWYRLLQIWTFSFLILTDHFVSMLTGLYLSGMNGHFSQ